VHRQENVDLPERLEKVLECLVAVRDEWKLPVLVSTHPRTKKRLEEYGMDKVEGITFHEPFGYLDYNKLQMNAKCVVSDSGTISEESAIMEFPAVSLRDSIERPESIDSGSMILAGLDPENLSSAIKIVEDDGSTKQIPSGYETSNFSDVVIKLLLSTASHHHERSGIRR
jgi:UDP-N-acetylglucosamine 2-epimerase